MKQRADERIPELLKLAATGWLLWELGRIEGLRQGAMMAGCLRVGCDGQQYRVIKRHIEETVRDIRTEANKLSKKWRRVRR